MSVDAVSSGGEVLVARVAGAAGLPAEEFPERVMHVRSAAALALFRLARFLVHPLWKMTSLSLKAIALYRDQQSTTAQKTASIAKTVFACLALLPFAIGGLVVGQVVHLSGFCLAPKPYFILPGEYSGEVPQQGSLFQLNCCLTAGGFSLPFGGIPRSNSERVKEIAALIPKETLHLCLQEVSDLEDALALYRALAPHFAEICLGPGMTPWVVDNNSGLLTASKGPMKQPQFHSFSKIPGTEAWVNKGYFLFSAGEGTYVVNTHFSPSSVETRNEEQQMILASIPKEKTFIAGDLNILPDTDEYRQAPLFRHFQSTQTAPTCETDFLIDRNWHKQESNARPSKCDHFLYPLSHPEITTKSIATFDKDHPENALSDHTALISVV